MQEGGNGATTAPLPSYLSNVDAMRTNTSLSVVATSLFVCVLRASPADDPPRARDAFMKAYGVFMHPRCQNCHPSGDTPLQGDDSHVHDLLRLRRGPDGNGVLAMKCTNCHQASNGPGPHTPPGAPQVAGAKGLPAEPRWHLPGPDARMVFQGRSPAELCRQLKDPKQNGGLTPDRLAHHVATDPLVLWAWNPGRSEEHTSEL